MRSRLTYANVVATLALILALGGGTVYAAIKLGKNDVKSKHIARGAVKTKDLGNNAVKSIKVKDGSIDSADLKAGSVTAAALRDGSVASADIKDGSVGSADLAAGLFDGIGVDVTGAAASGPRTGINTATPLPLTLTGDTSFTPAAGEVGALVAEGRFTIASTDPTKFCSPAVFLSLNGQPTRVFVNPEIDGNNTVLETSFGRDADGPFGLINPGTELTITGELRGDIDCTADSRMDRLEIRIVQIR